MGMLPSLPTACGTRPMVVCVLLINARVINWKTTTLLCIWARTCAHIAVKRSCSYLRVVEVYNAANGRVPSTLQNHDITFAQHVLAHVLQPRMERKRKVTTRWREERGGGWFGVMRFEHHLAIAHDGFILDVGCTKTALRYMESGIYDLDPICPRRQYTPFGISCRERISWGHAGGGAPRTFAENTVIYGGDDANSIFHDIFLLLLAWKAVSTSLSWSPAVIFPSM